MIANSKYSSWLRPFIPAHIYPYYIFIDIDLLAFSFVMNHFIILSLPVSQSRVYALFSVYSLKRRRTYWVCTLPVQLASMATRTTVYFASHVTRTDQWNKCTQELRTLIYTRVPIFIIVMQHVEVKRFILWKRRSNWNILQAFEDFGLIYSYISWLFPSVRWGLFEFSSVEIVELWQKT